MGSSFLGLSDNDQLNDGLLLINSVKNNHHFNVCSILDRGADPDVAYLEEPINLRTPLRISCAQANVKLARLLISRNADVFAHSSEDGWTAFHSACFGGHDHMARLLLVEADCLHENVEFEGWQLLHLLTSCLSSRLFESGASLLTWTLKQMPGLEVDAQSQRPGLWDWTPLHMACAKGCTKAAAMLLKAKADLHAVTGDFYISSGALNAFAKGDHAETCKDAGFDGVDPQLVDKGLLPIHLAAFGGHIRTVKLLVKRGQAINATTSRFCWTPLMFAVWSNNVELVQEICRSGGRKAINWFDRRVDGPDWTPIAIAVIRGTPEMVHVLLEYRADPLLRYCAADFPGSAFLGNDDAFSSPDSRISLLHLAVIRGCMNMIQCLLPVLRSAHFSPVRVSKIQPPLTDAIPWKDTGHLEAQISSSFSSGKRSLSASVRQKGAKGAAGAALDFSKMAQDRARERLLNGPVSEAQDCDPVAFHTAEGWSAAGLAVLLHTIDPQRSICGFQILQGFTDQLAANNDRSDVFKELLQTGVSFCEDKPDVSPPTMPSRFLDVSDNLVNRTISEFAKLCQENGADRVAFRILHTTLCVACRFNRYQVAQHLLQSGFCDPRCTFLRPVELRPLHIASAHGYGFLVDLLLAYKADPLEVDENQLMPVNKLAARYEKQIIELQAKVAELEARLAIAEGPSFLSSKAQSPTYGQAVGGREPVPTYCLDSILHDSRM